MFSPDKHIKDRLFIIGCPRSGTTLLQSCLASHTDILSFPESHFFTKLYPAWEPKRRFMRMASRRTQDYLLEYCEKIRAPEYKKLASKMIVFQFQYTNLFVRILDEITLQSNKHIWLEKTPEHLMFIDTIESLVKRPKFIHVLRDGADVVASLYEATSEGPRYWSGAWSIEKCIQKWVECVHKSNSYLSSEKIDHIAICYEDFVADPVKQTKRICQWLDIPFQEKMISQRQNLAQIIQPHESWKSKVGSEIKSTPREKFKKIFTPSEQDYILERTRTAQKTKESISS